MFHLPMPRMFAMVRTTMVLATVALVVASSLGGCTRRTTAPTPRKASAPRGSGQYSNDVWGLKFRYPPEWGEFRLGLVGNNGVQPVVFGIFTNNPEVTFVATNTLRSVKGPGYLSRRGTYFAIAVDDTRVAIPQTQIIREVRAQNTRILLFKEVDPSDKYTGLVEGQGSWMRASIFRLFSLNRNTLQQFEDMLETVEISPVKVATK